MATKNLLPILILLLSIIFAQVGVSQQAVDLLANSASIILSVIVVLSIVIVLLYLGGVIKGAPRGVPLGLVIFSVIFFVVFILPFLQAIGVIPPILPSEIKNAKAFMNAPFPEQIQPIMQKIFEFIPLQPKEVVNYIDGVIFLIILPFAALYAIVWGFLNHLKIFGEDESAKKINRVLAFIISLMTLPVGAFNIMIATIFAGLGWFAVVAFAIMFLGGVFFRGYAFTISAYYTAQVEKFKTAKEAQKKALAFDLAKLRTNVERTWTWDRLDHELSSLERAYPIFAPDIANLRNRLLANKNLQAQIDKDIGTVQQELDNFIKLLS